MSDLPFTFGGVSGPYAGDAELMNATERAVLTIEPAVEYAADRIGNSGAVLNALMSLWINHSVRIVGLAETLEVIGMCPAMAREAAALNRGRRS